ncbi:MAG: pyridoxamine 5'-phosphate oxidase family protein, partial [Aquihabitans sp.]
MSNLNDTEHETTAEHAQRIVGANKYLTLATVDAAGRPWATPVYFTTESETRFLWVSSPDARHSRNISERPAVAFTIFDSTVAFGRGEAADFDAHAENHAPTEVDQALSVFNSPIDEHAD